MRHMVMAAVLVLIPAMARAQETQEQPRTITVSATGTVEREPERAVVLFAVESEAATAALAAEANARRMTELIAALRREGIADRDIRTLSYELRPEYAREPRGAEPPRIVSYRAINIVQVTVDPVARLGRIIDTAVNSGANRVTNVRFELRDPRTVHLEAVQLAMQNARREAETVAAAAGQRLGPPLNITTGAYAPPPSPMPGYRMDAMEMAAATPVEPGVLTVTAHVHVVYRIENP